jgi:uncharacterized protein YggL (DUF469 family)
MRRRLRKKKHLGEFREDGFAVGIVLRAGLPAAEHNAFVDAFIAAIEARGLAFGGGGWPPRFDGFATRALRGSATDDDRAAMAAFLDGHPAVVAHEVGPLVDAWR